MLYWDAVFVRMSSIATIKNHDVRFGDFVVSLGWRKEHALRLRDITIRVNPTYKVTESRLDILRYLRVIVDSRDTKGKKNPNETRHWQAVFVEKRESAPICWIILLLIVGLRLKRFTETTLGSPLKTARDALRS